MLLFQAPPKIIEAESSPKQTSVQEGGTVELICNVTGNPIPEVEWYRGESETRNISKFMFLCCFPKYL